jgi:hypothetical protein
LLKPPSGFDNFGGGIFTGNGGRRGEWTFHKKVVDLQAKANSQMEVDPQVVKDFN